MRLFKYLLAALIAFTPAAPAVNAGWFPLDEPSSTPVSNACSNVSGTVVTFTAQGTGGANPNRISVVTINWSDSTLAGTSELNTVTIGGISMTRSVRASGDNQNSNSEIWYVANPTGTTANIVATFSTAIDGITIEVYNLIGYVTDPGGNTTGTTSATIQYNNKQLAIVAGSRTTNVSTSLSNLNTDFSSACGSFLWGVHSSQTLRGNNQSITTTISPTSNNPKIALAVWTTGNVVAGCTEGAAFLGRTSGLDLTHSTAYTNLICGLVTDGVWSKLDILYIFATQDTTTAQLNLVQTSYPATLHGSPTFTANRGYTGVGGSTVYIDTGFNPVSAPSPKYVLNSAHMSAWNLTDTPDSTTMGSLNGADQALINIKFSGNNNFYARINDTSAGGNTSGIGSMIGHWLASRDGSASTGAYFNGSNFFTPLDVSGAIPNVNMYVLGANSSGTPTGLNNQQAAITFGGSLVPPDPANLYSRLRTYMTAVGVP
jgi:hypothetical protein